MSRRKRRIPIPRRRKWTNLEDHLLLQGAGTYGWVWFKSKLHGRTPSSIRNRLYTMFGSWGVTRGSYSFYRLQQDTGYSSTQLLRARDATAQKWKRMSRTGDYLITEDQAGELCDWLRLDYWSKSKELYCCVWCGTAEKLHYSAGLCRRCYDKYRLICKNSGIPPSINDQFLLLDCVIRREDVAKWRRFLSLLMTKLKRGIAISRPQLYKLINILGEIGCLKES